MQVKKSTERVRKFREKLALPENIEKHEEYKRKNQEASQNFREKNVFGENSVKFKKKRSQQAMHSKLKKIEDNSKLQHDSTPSGKPFQSKKGLNKAVTKIKKNLPKEKAKAVEAVTVVANELGLNIRSVKDHQKILRGRKNFKDVPEIVRDFFISDSISRQMPGKKDTFTVKDGCGHKEVFQKRSMLLTVDSAYEEFKKLHINVEISRAKFYQLKPPYIVFISDISKDVCLCIYCENFNFLFQALRPFIDGIDNLKEFMKIFKCNDSFDCASNICRKCYDYESTLDLILAPLSEDKAIKWNKWIKVGSFLQKEILPGKILSDAIEEFSKTFKDYKLHVHLISVQHNTVSKLKNETNQEKAVIQMDYSENFTTFSQHEVQAAHFLRRQISIFTSVVTIDKSINMSYAIISDDLKHSKEQVYFYMEILVKEVKKKYPQLIHVDFITDGCASQFKNKFIMTNLIFIKTDLGITASWHFMPTSHGKSAADGIGGILKHQVSNRIKTGLTEIHCAKDFVNCANTFAKNIRIILASESEMDAAMIYLKDRWKNVKGLPGTQSLHFFEAIGLKKILGAVSSKREGAKFFLIS